MLVLTRKKSESIVIAGEVVVTVVSVCGDRVRLGVEAPREVPILRKELMEPTTHRVLVRSVVR